jgi:hypothetical protein
LGLLVEVMVLRAEPDPFQVKETDCPMT